MSPEDKEEQVGRMMKDILLASHRVPSLPPNNLPLMLLFCSTVRHVQAPNRFVANPDKHRSAPHIHQTGSSGEPQSAGSIERAKRLIGTACAAVLVQPTEPLSTRPQYSRSGSLQGGDPALGNQKPSS